MKTFFYVSLGIFVVSLLFLGVYNFAFKGNPNNPTADKETRSASQEEKDQTFSEGLQTSTVESVTDEAAIGPTVIGDNAIAYGALDGSIKKITYGGGGGSVLVGDLPGKPIRLVWSHDRTDVLALLSTPTGELWHSIDITTKSVIQLKPEMSSPSWTNLGDRIFYLYTRDGKTAINSAKPDGSDWKEYQTLPSRNYYLTYVPQSASVALWNRPSAYDETALTSINAASKESRRLFSGKFGANYLWSPNGDRLLVSAVDEKGGTSIALGVANGNGGEYRGLQVPTFIPKATWSKDNRTVYYALPLSRPDNTVFPNDYFDKNIRTADSFWKMDVETRKSDRVLEGKDAGSQTVDSIDLFLSPEEDYLFFTNRSDGKLYRIHLSR